MYLTKECKEELIEEFKEILESDEYEYGNMIEYHHFLRDKELTIKKEETK